jgi:signal recognition particle GTPase
MSGLDFHESGARIKKWLTMMDSMTNMELDDTKGLSQVRGGVS